jgi:hypothetical protein
MDETTDINELFNQGQVSSKKADETSKGPVDTVASYWNRGYAPEMIGGGVAATYGGFALKNYIKNLNAVKKAIASEEEAMRSLRTPATKSARQPFSKEGFMLSGGRDVKAVMPQKGGAVPYTRLSNIMPIGGPEGTGLGVLKGKEYSTAAKMTAEQMFRYLYPQSNLGVTATTPRIMIKGFQQGEPLRQTLAVTPENVKTGKLPRTKIPTGVLPAPEKSFIPKMAGKIPAGLEKIKGLFKKMGGGKNIAGGAFDIIPMALDVINRSRSDYENPLTGEVYRADEVTNLDGLNYVNSDLETIAMFHPDNAENHPEITDEMRANFFRK